jgi:hypothetical protein
MGPKEGIISWLPELEQYSRTYNIKCSGVQNQVLEENIVAVALGHFSIYFMRKKIDVN